MSMKSFTYMPSSRYQDTKTSSLFTASKLPSMNMKNEKMVSMNSSVKPTFKHEIGKAFNVSASSRKFDDNSVRK